MAFEVDSYEPDGRSGWSVPVIGQASKMLGGELEQAASLNLVSATS